MKTANYTEQRSIKSSQANAATPAFYQALETNTTQQTDTNNQAQAENNHRHSEPNENTHNQAEKDRSGSVKDTQAEQADIERLKEQARNEDEEQQRKADKEERRLAEQKAAEEQARLEREKAEEEQQKKEQEKQAEKQRRLEARRIREERLKQNTDGKTLLSKDDFDYNINLSSERNAMKHKAENRLAELQKGGIQADEKEEANKIKAVLKDIKQQEKASEAQVGFWTKVGASLPSLPDNVVNFSAGMGDFVSFGLTEKVREVADIDGGVDTNSTAYKAGEATGLTVGLVSGGSLATVGAKTISGKVARVSTAAIAADVAGRVATNSFSIQYDEQQCNALNKMASHKSPWIDGSKPLRSSDLTDEHNFLQEVGVAKKLPNGGYSYEVNGVDMAYVLTENRFSRSAGKTGLGMGKVTQIPATVMGVVGSDLYSLYTSIGNPKGTRVNEIKTDLKGTYMGAVLSLSKDMQTGVDKKCNKPNKR